METKVGMRIQSSFSKCNGNSALVNKCLIDAVNESKKFNPNADKFVWSSNPLGGTYDLNGVFSGDTLKQMEEFRKNLQQGGIRHIEVKQLAADDYLGKAERAYKFINELHDYMNESVSRKLKEFGVPEDVTFEFDYDIDNNKSVLTSISDEKYRDSVQAALDKCMSPDWIGNASRILNGHMSSVYYANIAKDLERCFGQDISELYLDENGNIGGANEKLQKALWAEKNVKDFDAEKCIISPSIRLKLC